VLVVCNEVRHEYGYGSEVDTWRFSSSRYHLTGTGRSVVYHSH